MTETCMTVTITKMLYGWSKWGGGTQGVATLMNDDNEWFCQVCKDRQTKNLPHYMLPMDGYNRDFVKICTKCKHTAIRKRLNNYYRLRKYIKVKIGNGFD